MSEEINEIECWIESPLPFNNTIFLSSTNTEPFIPISFLVDGVQIDQNSIDILSTEDYIYLINTIDYENISIRVENENFTGLSLYISEVDEFGEPIQFKKRIDYASLTVPIGDDYKITMLKYKWVVLNNLFLVKKLKYSGHVNIYQITG